VRAIRERLIERSTPNWNYPYPIATLELEIGSPDGYSKFIDAHEQLDTLFELKEVKGKTLEQVIEHLLAKMPACQREPFLEEQKKLIGRLLVGIRVDDIKATIPIVFESHERCAGQAILPIIVGYHLNMVKAVLRLRITYLDVTGVTKINKGE